MEALLEYGYFGLFLGTFLAGTILPLSSEIFFLGMLGAGADPASCLLWATFGNWLGTLTCYLTGRAGKLEWIEKIFRIPREKIQRQKRHIDKYGVYVSLFSWVPVVGNLSVITLGVYKADYRKTVPLLLVGCFARFLFWVAIFG